MRVNNALRSAIDAALGALTLANPDPAKRIAAAEAVFKSRDAKALPALEAQLAKETDPRAAAALRQARAAILALDADAADADRARGDRGAQGARRPGRAEPARRRSPAATDDPALKAAAQAALASIKTRLALWDVAQNVWYGLSAASVLLLAAIGLAITFGVMGVINMAHGEMVMLGAYTTFVVQSAAAARARANGRSRSRCRSPSSSRACVGIVDRALRHPLSLRPAARDAARHLGRVADPAAGGAHDLRRQQPSGQRARLHVGRRSRSAACRSRPGRLWIIVLAILVFVALQLVLRATPFGLRMRAVTQNRRMAAAMGISTGRIDMFAFGLGSGIAGVAGVALSQIDNVSPNLGQGYIIDSFMVVVLGGVGNLWGTLLGALTLGLANKLLEPVIGAVLGKILLLVFIILFIQKRPRGLFALKGRAVEA